MLYRIRRWLCSKLAVKSDPLPPQRETIKVFFHRMTPEVYAAFEKAVHANTIVTQTSSDLQVGWQMGIQHALSALRKDIVVGS